MLLLPAVLHKSEQKNSKTWLGPSLIVNRRLRWQDDEPWIDFLLGLFAFLNVSDVLVNGFYQLFAAFTCQGRNFKDRSFELEPFDEILDNGGAFVVVHHVKLVEH